MIFPGPFDGEGLVVHAQHALRISPLPQVLGKLSPALPARFAKQHPRPGIARLAFHQKPLDIGRIGEPISVAFEQLHGSQRRQQPLSVDHFDIAFFCHFKEFWE